MSEKLAHLCVTKETFRPADISIVRWLTAADYEAVIKGWDGKAGARWALEEWKQLLNEGYLYAGILSDDRVCSIAGVWKRATDVWEVIAVGTKKEYRRQGMAKTVVSFAVEYILQHVNVASYTSRESNIASIRTAQSVGFQYCTNMIGNDKWCTKEPRTSVQCVICPLINSSFSLNGLASHSD